MDPVHLLLTRPLHEAPQTQIVDHVLNPLDIILDSIGTLAQNIVLEVEDLEPGEQVLDKRANNERHVKVTEGNGVGGQARQILRQVGEGEEIFLNGDVEGVIVLEVRGDCEIISNVHFDEEGRFGTFKDRANVIKGEKAAELSGPGVGGQATEPGAVEGRGDGALDGTSPFRVVPSKF